MDKGKAAMLEMFDRYEKGSTSLDEDQVIFDHVTNEQPENVSESLRAQFIYFNNKKNEPLPKELESQLHAKLVNSSPRQVKVQLLLRIAAILFVCFGIGWFTIPYVYENELTVSTGPAEQTRVVLPDGTIVFLNSSSELIYTKTFSDHDRVVHLKGEAYFDVHHDTLKPFIIYTGKVTTEVLGTSFNLRYYENEKLSEINVRSGQVRFGTTKKVMLTTGQRATQGLHDNAIEVTKSYPNSDAWKTRILSFENATMKDVVRDMERYFSLHIEVSNAALLDCHFTGRFNDPRLEEFLNVITYSLNIHYAVDGNTCILSGQHCKP